MALARLRNQSRRLQKTPAFLSDYEDIIQKQVKLGIIEEVTPHNSVNTNLCHYLPHHAVLKPTSATTKVRVVHDASAKQSKDALSLNDCLFRGPVFLGDICGLLLRFRLNPVAFVCDIEKAFFQVGLRECDRDVTRFLWLRDPCQGVTPQNLVTYRFARVPFGVISSPYLLGATVKHHLLQNDSAVSHDIASNIYVDNIISGADSTEKAREYYEETQRVFNEISMNVREWFTNDKDFFGSIQKKHQGTGPTSTVLGMVWNTEADVLSFSDPKFEKILVRSNRHLIQAVSRAYDPCGLLAPVLTKTKVLVQDAWRKQIKWDEPLPTEMLETRASIKSDMMGISGLRVPRFIGMVNTDWDIHCFCDASAKAYAAAVYLRSFSGISHLVFSKCRLAPLKTISLPRLELMAVVTGVRLISFVKQQLNCNFSRTFAWSDSKCVLHWISSSKVLSTFVSNRRRLQKTPAFLSDYEDIIQKQVKLGIIEEVTPHNSVNTNLCHYLPHHAVLKPTSATTKVRVVHDASAKQSKDALSLNDCLFRGPVFLGDICGLLLRFRLNPVAFVCDIEKAFFQVGLRECDRDVTRFLWLRDPCQGVTPQNLVTYRFARVPFGVISSPYLLGATVKHHLLQNDSAVSHDIASNIYVDNIISGADSTEKAREYYEETQRVFNEISMNVREWFTNDKDFFGSIQKKHQGTGPTSTVLGMVWNTEADVLSFSDPKFEKILVRSNRHLIQAVSRAYDPCGLLAPVLTKTKVLVQDAWRKQIKWDEPLPTEMLETRASIKSDMMGISGLRVPRFIGMVNTDWDIHCFCDASAKAYAAAVYLRSFSGISHLVFSKCRLAPLKTISLPRLELMAVVTGVRLISFVKQQLNCNFSRTFAWSDSKCVLHWISSSKVLSTFVSNRRRLQKTPAFLSDYEDIIQKQVKLGIIEEVTPHNSVNTNLCHYLPHHAVLKPTSATTKVRVVHDASAKQSKDALSLNDCLFRGPVFLGDICGLLLRFRLNPVAFVCDIEKAFFQVGLRECDRDVTRFLWLRDPCQGVTPQNLVTYRFARVPFGVISSPYLLGATVKHHLLQNDSAVSHDIASNIYVDNIISGADSTEKAREYYEETQRVFNEISMNVREWFTNDKDFFGSIQKKHQGTGPTSTVLGMVWNTEADVLSFSDPKFEKILVRSNRHLIQAVSRAYDPCGLLAPVLTKTKVLVQDAWRKQIKWDEPLPTEMLETRASIKSDMMGISGLRVPRFIGMVNTDWDIHCFCDASAKAYAAAVYLRSFSGISHLVFRCEFPCEFRYVPTSINPADIPTRGLPAKELADSSLWWNGPQFLEFPESEWPATLLGSSDIGYGEETPIETMVVESSVEITRGPLYIDASRCSSLCRLLRITAYAYRFVHKLLDKVKRRSSRKTDDGTLHLWIHEIRDAKVQWVRQVQKDVDKGKGFAYLKRQLDLFKDSNGIWRCNGRLHHANVSDDTKFPILLTKSHPFTTLVIKDCHERVHHSGQLHTLAELRSAFWVPNGKTEVNRVIQGCQICRLWEGGSYKTPPFPPLPSLRVNRTPPFAYTGVDYMGPLVVSNGGNTQKVWICLFTCAVTRAIHLEVVANLSTYQFLLCLRRFIASFGRPEVIISDNGKYFKLANDVLKRLWAEICKSPNLYAFLSHQDIQWKFITEYSPWMGGFYERLVGSAKRSLKKVLGRKLATLEQLQTLVTEVSAVLNSRPLVLSNDVRDEILSPSDLLGKRVRTGMVSSVSEDIADQTFVPNPNLASDLIQSWKENDSILNQFWDIWQRQYLTALRERSSKQRAVPGTCPFPVQVGVPVLIHEEKMPRSVWKVGVIHDIRVSGDGVVRLVVVKLPSGKQMTRPVKLLHPLEVPLAHTHNEHAQNIGTKTRKNDTSDPFKGRSVEGDVCPVTVMGHTPDGDIDHAGYHRAPRPKRKAAEKAKAAIHLQLTSDCEDDT